MRKRLIILLFLFPGMLYAGESRLTFVGTANDSADSLPAGASTVLGMQASEVCVDNLDTTDNLYVKPCASATCTADATEANCTDGDGCAQWVIPPGKAYCFNVKSIRKLSTDMAAGLTADYVITATGQSE